MSAMHNLSSLRYVAAGGAIGALTRWAVVGVAADGRAGLAIFFLNVIGSVLLGVLVGASHPRRGRQPVTGNQFLLVGAGFCGALTTFSTYAVDVATSLDEGRLLPAALTGFGTAVTAVVGAGIGYRLGRRP
jgi:CrcB protein